ncbi:hypothetical protein Q4489_10785 [Thalassotalea sp. 1_MG-2023]|uniref:hypothetical protein n=1 Tax=Thalassotalea sp. 1_MG-2023 TaxID=3062680 RepID=UPI0026E281DD|nr:hypothetical protein [Thalassotalea sp. 1_MG-2023]MDO6427504.1 hypothetical protein [Thalassotalea sp. 1_MG-2023]
MKFGTHNEKKDTKSSLIIITLISICILITFFIQDVRSEVDGPLFSLILGSAPSFFYTLGMLLICFLVSEKEHLTNCIYVLIGSLIYEISQLFGSEARTFDYSDVLAICLAFVFFILLIYRSGYLPHSKSNEFI